MTQRQSLVTALAPSAILFATGRAVSSLTLVQDFVGGRPELGVQFAAAGLGAWLIAILPANESIAYIVVTSLRTRSGEGAAHGAAAG
jgi:hypothetical protein